MIKIEILGLFSTFFLYFIFYNNYGDKMIIYLDLVFFLNIFLDFILLMSVSVVLTRNVSLKRIFLGSIIGGGSTFILFFSISSIILFLIKLFLGFFMVLVTFGYHSLKYTYNNLFYLYTISFSIGGVLYLLMNKGYYNYLILIIGFLVVSYLYVKQIKKFKTNYSDYYQVKVYLKNQVLNLTGYLDTGNKLYDNYKNRPVIITSKKIMYDLEDIIYVPYVSLNDEKIIKCLKVDKIIINNKVFHNYLIGLSDQKILIDGVNCILHSKMKGEL